MKCSDKAARSFTHARSVVEKHHIWEIICDTIPPDRWFAIREVRKANSNGAWSQAYLIRTIRAVLNSVHDEGNVERKWSLWKI
jgi:hypothetical protein